MFLLYGIVRILKVKWSVHCIRTTKISQKCLEVFDELEDIYNYTVTVVISCRYYKRFLNEVRRYNLAHIA